MDPTSQSVRGGKSNTKRSQKQHPSNREAESSWIEASKAEEQDADVHAEMALTEDDDISLDEFELLQQSKELPPVAINQLADGVINGQQRQRKSKLEYPHIPQQSRQSMRGMSSSAYDMVDDKSQLMMPTIDHTANTPKSPIMTSDLNTKSVQNPPLRQRWTQAGTGTRPTQSSSNQVSATPSSSSKKKRKQHHRQESQQSVIWETWNEFATFTAGTLGRSLRLIQTPLSWIISGLVIYLFSQILFRGAQLKAQSLLTGMVCRVPLLPSLLVPDLCPSDHSSKSSGPLPPAEFDRLMASNAHLEELISSKAEAVALPAIMKRSEASIRDVRTLVTASTLKSRGQLLLELDAYVDSSRLAVRDLSQFHSHVDRAADNILYTARWTRRVLGDIESERTISGGSGSDGALIQNSFLRSLFGLSQLTTPEQAILARYVEHAEAVEGQIHRLLLEAEALYQLLQHLDDRLDVLGSIAARDGSVAEVGRADVLAELWTLLGGNKRKLARYDHELAILRQVDLQRRLAMDQVGDAVVQLRSMEAELSGLRERVGAAKLTGEGAASEGHGIAAVPISLHLENVERGVRRLEAARDDSRRKFDEFQDKAWGRGPAVDGSALSGDQDGFEDVDGVVGSKKNRIGAD